MANPRLQTRVDEETKQRVEQYQTEVGTPTQSETVRRLVLEGLQSERGDNDDPGFAGLWLTVAGAVAGVAAVGSFFVLSTAATAALSLTAIATNAAAYLTNNR